MSSRAVGLLCAVSVIASAPSHAGLPTSYAEDFTTTAFRDPVTTTAEWDTTSGEVRLTPFTFSLIGELDTAGAARDVVLAGDVAYVADRAGGLGVIDVTDPANPSLTSTFATPDVATGVVADGDAVLVADGASGLVIVDVSDPSIPVLEGSLDTSGFATALALAGRVAFVADGAGGLHAVDVDDRSNPMLLDTVDTAGDARGVALHGDLALVADGTSGLQIIDITDPANLVLIGSVNPPGEAYDVAVNGDVAFVANGTGGLHVIDITDPTSPSLAGTASTPGVATGIFARGDVAYVADGASGVYLFDVRDPSSPYSIGGFDTSDAGSVIVGGDLAYVADGTRGLVVVDVWSAPDPELVTTIGTTDAAGVAISGDVAYVADQAAGLLVYDISEPAAPALLSTYGTLWGGATSVEIAGDVAYVGATGGVEIVDISDPANPGFLSLYDTTGIVNRMHVAGNLLYVADRSTLLILDVADPSDPHHVGQDVRGERKSIDVAGEHAYVPTLAEQRGIDVYDVTSPSSPNLVGFYGTSDPVDVYVAGDILYVAELSDGLLALDISVPPNISFVGSTLSSVGIEDVVVSGDYAYTVGAGGLIIVDVSDPANPAPVAGYASAKTALAEAGELALLVRESGGVDVARFFQNVVDTTSGVAQSIEIDAADHDVVRAWMSATASIDVDLELSADGGTSWQTFAPGSWDVFDMPGSDLVWRSTHTWTPAGNVNPTLFDLAIEWRYAFATIQSVSDVPNDQGGRVVLSVGRSGYDFLEEATSSITEYHVWIRVSDTESSIPASDQLEHTTVVPGMPTVSADGIDYVRGASGTGMPPGVWAHLDRFPALQIDEYGVLAETLADSSAGGSENWAVYTVTAHTADPLVWFASPPDSGRSVDNLAPGPPAGLVFTAPGLLKWDDPAEPDFDFFTVYGSANGEHHSTATRIGYTIETEMDVSGAPFSYYHVTTTDFAGNEGPDAIVEAPLTVEDPGLVPPELMVHPARPNPFRSTARIVFDVPSARHVQLSVYDVNGRLVRLLVDGEVMGGRYVVEWSGVDEHDHRAPAGVYFVRLQSSGTRESVSVVLLD